MRVVGRNWDITPRANEAFVEGVYAHVGVVGRKQGELRWLGGESRYVATTTG